MAASDADMTVLLRGFIQIGHTTEWLKAKGFPEDKIQQIILEEASKRERERLDAKARAEFEAKAAAQQTRTSAWRSAGNAGAGAGAGLGAGVAPEPIGLNAGPGPGTGISPGAGPGPVAGAGTRSEVHKQADKKAQREIPASPELGWLRAIRLSSKHFGGTTESPPISPDLPHTGPRNFSAARRDSLAERKHLADRATPPGMTHVLEKSLFKRHAQAMIAICRLLKAEIVSDVQKFQTLEEVFAQRKYQPYSNTTDMLIEILSRAKNEFEGVTFFHKDHKDLSDHTTDHAADTIHLSDIEDFSIDDEITEAEEETWQQIQVIINFFTALKIESIIEELSKRFHMESNNSTPSHSPALSPRLHPLPPSLPPSLNLSGSPNLGPSPNLSASPSLNSLNGSPIMVTRTTSGAAASSIALGSMPARTQQKPARIADDFADDLIFVDNTNWFQRLLEVILNEKLTCPEGPENLTPIIETMKSKTKRRNLRS